MADTEFVHAISAGIGGECGTSPNALLRSLAPIRAAPPFKTTPMQAV